MSVLLCYLHWRINVFIKTVFDQASAPDPAGELTMLSQIPSQMGRGCLPSIRSLSLVLASKAPHILLLQCYARVIILTLDSLRVSYRKVEIITNV